MAIERRLLKLLKAFEEAVAANAHVGSADPEDAVEIKDNLTRTRKALLEFLGMPMWTVKHFLDETRIFRASSAEAAARLTDVNVALLYIHEVHWVNDELRVK